MALDDPIVFVLIFFFLLLVLAIVVPRGGIRGVLLVGGVWMFILAFIFVAITLHFVFGILAIAIGAAMIICRTRFGRRLTSKFSDRGFD